MVGESIGFKWISSKIIELNACQKGVCSTDIFHLIFVGFFESSTCPRGIFLSQFDRFDFSCQIFEEWKINPLSTYPLMVFALHPMHMIRRNIHFKYFSYIMKFPPRDWSLVCLFANSPGVLWECVWRSLLFSCCCCFFLLADNWLHSWCFDDDDDKDDDDGWCSLKLNDNNHRVSSFLFFSIWF